LDLYSRVILQRGAASSDPPLTLMLVYRGYLAIFWSELTRTLEQPPVRLLWGHHRGVQYNSFDIQVR
jgi:hypothetical protein